MIRRMLILVVLVLTFSLTVYAQSDSREALTRAGYRVVGQRVEGGLPTLDLQHESGLRVSVVFHGELTAQQLEALRFLRETIVGIRGLVAARLRLLFEGPRVDVLVVPESFTVQGRELARFMPSGMQFSYTDTLQYDFRLLVDNLALRMSGRYFTAEQFTDRLLRAIEAPAAYIQSQDPEFLFRRLDEQQRLLEERAADDRRQDEADRSIRAEIADQVQRGEAAVALGERAVEQLHATIAQLRADHEALATAYQQLRGAHETLAVAHSDLGSDYRRLREELEVLRDGAVVLFTRGLFGGLKPLPREVIQRVVDLRAADPRLSADAVRATVAGEFPASGIHKKHVQAIFGYFFNQYE